MTGCTYSGTLVQDAVLEQSKNNEDTFIFLKVQCRASHKSKPITRFCRWYHGYVGAPMDFMCAHLVKGTEIIFAGTETLGGRYPIMHIKACGIMPATLHARRVLPPLPTPTEDEDDS